MKYYDNFLKDSLDLFLLRELETLTTYAWKDFNRNESHMKEYYGEGQFINKMRQYLHSKKCIEWVEKESGIEGLVVDTLGTGEGISLMEPEDKLDPHIDFNWNNRIKMHRAVNLTIYLGDATGGEFTTWDEYMNFTFGMYSEAPKHNSAILFPHSETKAHGVKPITSGQRYAIRQFYYKSEATCDNPHQSLYWYNPDKKMATNTE
tara:strand:+ start:588 stop:1202 length:615 start_codon:yes stop_codon:yes gene_type:complete